MTYLEQESQRRGTRWRSSAQAAMLPVTSTRQTLNTARRHVRPSMYTAHSLARTPVTYTGIKTDVCVFVGAGTLLANRRRAMEGYHRGRLPHRGACHSTRHSVSNRCTTLPSDACGCASVGIPSTLPFFHVVSGSDRPSTVCHSRTGTGTEPVLTQVRYGTVVAATVRWHAAPERVPNIPLTTRCRRTGHPTDCAGR